MGTVLRTELSKKSKWWIEKHRRLELKHFCLQYPIWKKAYASLDDFSLRSNDLQEAFERSSTPGNPTAKMATAKAHYANLMKMVEDAAKEASPELWEYILKGVTEERSYDYLRVNDNIPCGKDMYYDLYRKFFWILSKARN